MPIFDRYGIRFHYLDLGEGLPFVFQHGLGGDVNQPAGIFRPPAGIRLLSLDGRAHGATQPVGPTEDLDFDHFADDLIALLDHLAIPKAVIGGISMGAGVALNIALRYPTRTAGIVLSRPAWLDGPMPPANVVIYAQIAALLRQYGPCRGRDLFVASETYREIDLLSPDAARSLVGQFTNDRALDGVARLERMPLDRPVNSLRNAAAITVPALILANRQDPVHPFGYGEILAAAIPNAIFQELTPKSVSKQYHEAEVQQALEEFLSTLRIEQPVWI